MQAPHQDPAAIRAWLLEQCAALTASSKALDPAVPTCLECAAGPGR